MHRRAFTSWIPTTPAARVTPACGGRSVRLAPARKSGFSLLELILVMVLIGIASAVVAARLVPLHQDTSLKQAARALEDQFNRGRNLARSHGAMARLRLDLDNQTATVEVRLADAFAAPKDGDDAACSLRKDGVDQTLSFAPDAAEAGAPAASPFAAASSAPTDAQAQTSARTSGLVDILFYPDARCSPSGRATLAKGGRTATVTLPAAGLPARLEGTP